MKLLKDKSDDQLISLYVDGKNEAFDELLERHKDRIFMYIYHSVKNEDLANDLFQDTFVKAITTIKQGRYVENGHFAAWVSRIAHNLIIDYFRQVKNENLQSTDDDESNILNRKELSQSTIEDDMVASQIHNDVRRLIRTLPASQRQVLVMRYYKNMSFKEIADTTGVSINTALGRMRYAILNMRRLAEEHNIVLTL
ncbi:MAG: sigma-70 family RNA polymerase sigma factor [Muribaculaceae bacterium]|jgi:RNA polymerase sigma-70 factor (ECF subfamily)|nr:sigma-70 family RNA polymerase sigma factor [Bacteroidales bacterium]MBQ1583721.1 sigma-70 family RNA polymerase sigma factor [Muribaculaceae bacterium]MBR0492806.1 sigma-70 family RNA polymerase sigma factor [Muribaculaceae bacterium]